MNPPESKLPADPSIPVLTEVLKPGEVPATPSPAMAPAEPLALPHDIAVLAERLSLRLSTQLSEEVTALVEKRCHDALIDHTAWLVQTIARHVSDDLQRQLREHVRRVVLEELARRN
ncbi:DUF2486 family protein [Pandoraea sp.]|uniref:DUF2486 family protein n=1 Tax=Pandoraea sp. TaxID=1883445 RepID=UPI001200EC81|nr:DUF2486 family protein [Pandoraea sp.]TAL54422.1 MAG: DUF2486 family protein [Pandoraea sp.]TAM17471.1 MAG: DUF2486 family protein [Pandoraea sp.]